MTMHTLAGRLLGTLVFSAIVSCSAPSKVVVDTKIPSATKRYVPVVMISVDGLKPDYVLEADRYGLKLPTL